MITGEPFEDYLKKQISDRQIVHGKGVNQNRTPQELAYLNSRTSWVKLASSTSISSSRLDLIPELKGSGLTGTQLAQQYVLFNGSTQILTKETSPKTTISTTPGSGGPTTIKAQKADAPPGTMVDIPNPDYTPPGTTTTTTPGSFTGKQGSPRAGILGGSPNPAYGATGNTDFGLVPMPGIEEATIRTLEMGSIKRASLVIKAHNRLQFDIIDMLYLRLGFTIMLEWGDSHYIENDTREIRKTGNTLIENFWFKQNPDTINSFKILGKIEKQREKYSASYDALFGRIENFKWTFNPDGSYTINLDILSMGDVIESLKMNTAAYKNFEDLSVPPANPTFLNDNLFKTTLENLFYPILKYYNEEANEEGVGGTQQSNKGEEIKIISYKFGDEEIVGNTIPYEVIDSLKLLPKYDLANTNDEPGTIRWNKAFNQGSQVTKAQFNKAHTVPPVDYIRTTFLPKAHSYYIRFGALLNIIEKIILPYINRDTDNPMVKIDNRVENNLMYYVPNMVSIDPRVCIISNDLFKQPNPEGTAIVDEKGLFTNIEKFVYRNENGNSSYGRIMNIYLNFSYLIKSELDFKTDKKGNVFIMDFFRNLCDNINRVLGGVNNLTPKMRPSDNTIYFFDQSALPGKEELPEYIFKKSSLPKGVGQFNLYGYGIGGTNKPPKNSSNFIHRVGIETSITPEYATIISIGATAAGHVVNEDATAFSKWNIGIKDRFRTDVATGYDNTQIIQDQQEKERKKYQINRHYLYTIGKRYDERFLYLGLNIETPSPGFFSGFGNFAKNIFLGQALIGTYIFNGLPYASTIRQKILNYYQNQSSDDQNSDLNGQPLFINNELIAQNLQVFTAYYKSIHNEAYQTYDKAAGTVGFMPFRLQLDMDGISGMKIYNKIDIDSRFLPSNYPETLEFIVTNVTHTIKNHQWVTSIDSIASVGNLFSTKELESVSALPENFQVINFLPTVGQFGGVTNVNQLAKSQSTNGPNANKLRATLSQLGYREKGVEIDNGGDITANTEKMASAIFRKIKELYPSIQITVTGGNDYFHTQLPYTSRHTRGRGIDFVISPATEQNLDNVVSVLDGFAKGGNGNVRYIDEYRDPSTSASAKHFHISYGQGTEGASALRKAQQSDAVAYTIPNDDPPNGVSGEDRESMYRAKQREIREINQEIEKLGSPVRFNPNIIEGTGKPYNAINPELQEAREFLNYLKRNPNAQYGPTSTQDLLDQSPTGILSFGDPVDPSLIDPTTGFIADP